MFDCMMVIDCNDFRVIDNPIIVVEDKLFHDDHSRSWIIIRSDALKHDPVCILIACICVARKGDASVMQSVQMREVGKTGYGKVLLRSDINFMFAL